MYFQFVFCRCIYLRSISHATSFSRLLCLRPRRVFSVFFLRPAESGRVNCHFVRSRATLKIPYLSRKYSSCLPACQVHFCLTKHACLLYLETIRWCVTRSIPIIPRKFPLQEAHNLRVHLFEFKEKAIVPVLRLDHD